MFLTLRDYSLTMRKRVRIPPPLSFNLKRSNDLVEDGVVSGAEEDESEDSDQPVFSLITGSYRHAKRYGGKDFAFY
jgi:hypothetical protein